MFKKALVASAALMSAGVASAAVTGNFAITSDYIFRGVDSSAGAAVQGGLDYSHESGLYAGIWMSNSTLGNSNGTGTDEIDYYVGYGLGLSDGLSLDFGIINYNSDAPTGSTAGNNTINELYVGVAGEAWDATIYVGDRDDTTGGANSDLDEYIYLDLNYSMSTGETTSVDLHLGYLDEADKTNTNLDAYDVSITYNVGDFGIGVTYRDADEPNGTAPSGDDETANLFVSWGTEFDVK